MSEQSKKTVKEVEETFKRISREAEDAGKKAGALGDKELVTRITKVKEGSDQVGEHIQKRRG